MQIPEDKDMNTFDIGIITMQSQKNLSRYRESVLSEFSLNSIQWYVLGAIFNTKTDKTNGIRITELAKKFDVKSTYITAVVNGLKDKKLVNSKIDPNDARARIVTLTKKGLELIPTIDNRLKNELLNYLENKVSIKELESYIKVLSALAYNPGMKYKPKTS